MENIKEKIRNLLRARAVQYEEIDHGRVLTLADVEREIGGKTAEMIKALIVKTPEGFILAALPGDRKLDRKKLADFLGYPGKRVDLIPADQVEGAIGLPLGAITPIAIGLPVVMDESVAKKDQVFCGMGTLFCTLKIKAADLIWLSEAKLTDISQ
jgi:prolyl-tRNA editing enzyme YbaK/EbsC (Cys-tRNA(Pro) deacylase)